MRALVIKEDCTMNVVNLRSKKQIRNILGGDIENIYLDEGMTTTLMINESSKLIGMNENPFATKIVEHFSIDTDYVAGPAVITSIGPDGLTSISEEMLEKIFAISGQYSPISFYQRFLNENRGFLSTVVDDPDSIIFSFKGGAVEGVYIIYFIHSVYGKITAYIGQAGKVPNQPSFYARTVHTRCTMHLKRWLGGGYLTYFTGLPEVSPSGWKIRIRLVCRQSDPALRHQIEKNLILSENPMLQDHKYESYPGPIDTCILPKYRKIAFEERLKQLKTLKRT